MTEDKPRFESLDKLDKKLEKFQEWALQHGGIIVMVVGGMFCFVVACIVKDLFF